jgi:hypothetical protein
MIDRSIVAGLNFGGFPGYHANDAETIGEIMWKGKVQGSRVSHSDLVRARNLFLSSPKAGMLPLLPPIPDEYVMKAIFEGPGQKLQNGATTQDEYDQRMAPLHKALAKDAERYQEDLCKAICAELPESNEIRKALTAATSNLMHVIADQDVTYLYKRPYPLQALIPTEANKVRPRTSISLVRTTSGRPASVQKISPSPNRISRPTTVHRTSSICTLSAVSPRLHNSQAWPRSLPVTFLQSALTPPRTHSAHSARGHFSVSPSMCRTPQTCSGPPWHQPISRTTGCTR